jgi:hypothetical protein
MGNLNARLGRLEKRYAAPVFSPWQWLWGQEPPAGWTLPAEWQALLAELRPGPQPDVYEEMIAKALAYTPTDEELAERLADLERQKSILVNGKQKGNHQ